jgi:hypothetical protein
MEAEASVAVTVISVIFCYEKLLTVKVPLFIGTNVHGFYKIP